MPGFIVLVLALLVAPVAGATEVLPGPYAAEVLRVIDGDSFEARVRIWLGQDATVSVRIAGIDAPEPKGPCAEAGRAARDRLASLLPDRVSLIEVRRDKYGGRVVAAVRLPDGENLGGRLVAEGHARPYDGGTREACR